MPAITGAYRFNSVKDVYSATLWWEKDLLAFEFTSSSVENQTLWKHECTN